MEMSSATQVRGTLPIPTYPDLSGKVALIAGGSGSIGGATCRALAANGVKVAVHGRDEAKIGRIVDQIQAEGGQAIGVVADVTDFAASTVSRPRPFSLSRSSSICHPNGSNR